MLPVLVTPQGENDWREILEYLMQHSPEAAERLAAAIERKCKLLSEFPLLGRERSELSKGIRSVVVGRYVVFYRVMDDAIHIVRILHSRQDQARQFKP